jgi:serine/threonine-protein kinase
MFDIGEHLGEKFLTMELIDGAPLLSKGTPSLPEAIAIASAVCAGLGAAHAVGVVHRDLKPDNVLLGKDGRVVITDFGIASASDREKTMGGVVGTPAYMAPEQVEGSATDGRTDLFALGVLLYQMLTKSLPWQEPQPFANAMARLLRPAPDPRTRRPELPEPLARLVLRALARKPEDRPATAAEFAAALAAIDLRPPEAPADQPITLSGGLSHFGALGTRSMSTAPGTLPPLTSLPPVGAVTPHGGHPIGSRSTTKTLAVLPIRNLGPAEDAYLAEGLTEELIDTLSMTAGLRVRPRGSVAALRDKDLDPREAGQRLGVQLIIEGTLRRIGQAVRISARLSSVADGFQIWAKRFERPAADLLQVSDEAVHAIADALTVTPAASLGPGTSDPQALDLYLRARYAYNHGEDQALEQAIGLFQQAVALAPEDPAILAGYAMACARGWFFGVAGTSERAAEIAERLMQISPHRGEPHIVKASLSFQQGDPAGAADGLRRALVLSPGMAETYALLGRVLLETGPVEDGLRALHHALALDPTLHERLYVELARAHAMLGQWDETEKVIRSHPPSRRSWILRARLCSWRSDQAAARQMMQDPDMQSGRHPEVMLMLRLICRELTEADRATFGEFFRRLSGSARTRIFSFQIRTETECAMQNFENAEQMLKSAVEAGLMDLMWMEHCQLLEPLRRLPSYPALHAQVRERTIPMANIMPAQL